MQLYIIRHGETLWNTEGRLQGRADISLNENGIRLARITGERMKDISFDLAISSPLSRAKQTAKLVLEGRNLPVLEDKRLEEISFGEWEGLCCKKEGYQIPSDEFPKFFSDPFQFQPPRGGESILQVIERTGDFYRELTENPEYQDKTILLASHGCSCRALLYQVCGENQDFWKGHVPPNCSVSLIEVAQGVGKLISMDKIYYDSGDLIDFYGAE